MTMRAVWKGTVLAESDDTVVVEGNHYFPRESLALEHFLSSDHRSMCPWKGIATYYTIEVAGSRNEDAAWEYESPTILARHVTGRVAFRRGVEVVDEDQVDAQGP